MNLYNCKNNNYYDIIIIEEMIIVAKLEKEVKILAINMEETQKKLDSIGAIFKGRKEQKIYTYDVLSIKYRIYEAIELLKSKNELLITTSLRKLNVVFDELYDLVDDEKLDKIFNFCILIFITISNFFLIISSNHTKFFQQSICFV